MLAMLQQSHVRMSRCTRTYSTRLRDAFPLSFPLYHPGCYSLAALRLGTTCFVFMFVDRYAFHMLVRVTSIATRRKKLETRRYYEAGQIIARRTHLL